MHVHMCCTNVQSDIMKSLLLLFDEMLYGLLVQLGMQVLLIGVVDGHCKRTKVVCGVRYVRSRRLG
jgi:hypothetical protein